MNRLLSATVALGLVAAACKPTTDLNQSCLLVKRNPDAGAPLVLLEKEVQGTNGQNDFISIGSLDCEDLICVRDAFYVSDAGGDQPATGYCSRQCAAGSACPSYDESMDRGPNALHCRPLLLSADTLAQDGGLFPGVRDPYFCARGDLPDSGM